VYLPGDDFERFLTRPTPIGAWVAVEDDDLVGHVALNQQTGPEVEAMIRASDIDGASGWSPASWLIPLTGAAVSVQPYSTPPSSRPAPSG
jgi:hypothetical protein